MRNKASDITLDLRITTLLYDTRSSLVQQKGAMDRQFFNNFTCYDESGKLQLLKQLTYNLVYLCPLQNYFISFLIFVITLSLSLPPSLPLSLYTYLYILLFQKK